MTYTVIGTDTSVWEGLIDIQKNKEAGASFIIPRAGIGLNIDGQFWNTWKNAKGVMPRGAYWYLSIKYSIRQQAEKFASCFLNDPGEIEPYVDFEEARQFMLYTCPSSGKRGWNVLSASELNGFIVYFRQAILKTYPVWPWKSDMGIYTGYSYWREHGSTSSAWNKYPLWISNPNPVDEPPPLMPWTTWRFWQTQFAADGVKFGTDPLVAKGIDLNSWNGTQQQFNNEFNINPQPLYKFEVDVLYPDKPYETIKDVVSLTIVRADNTKETRP